MHFRDRPNGVWMIRGLPIDALRQPRTRNACERRIEAPRGFWMSGAGVVLVKDRIGVDREHEWIRRLVDRQPITDNRQRAAPPVVQLPDFAPHSPGRVDRAADDFLPRAFSLEQQPARRL